MDPTLLSQLDKDRLPKHLAIVMDGMAYAELYFTPILWPDFRRDNLLHALLDYQQRERRFGLIHEQLTPAVSLNG